MIVKGSTSNSVSPKIIDFHFLKSSQFRVVHADGVYGGITPHGNVHCTFYSERPTIPKKTRIEIGIDGMPIAPEQTIETLGGIVREVEVDVVMTFAALASFYFWLSPKLEALRKSVGVSDSDWETMKRSLSDANSVQERNDAV